MVNFINFNFPCKKSENINSDKFLIDIYLNSLNFHYNSKNFRELLSEIHNQILNNNFLTSEVKQRIIKNYNINRSIIRSINKLKGKYKVEKQSVINPNFLNLEPTNISDIDNNIVINEKNTNKIYLFTHNEIVSLYKMALENQEESVSYPVYPKNPYTNIKFTTVEHINIFQKLTKYFSKKGTQLPIILRMFKDSKYNVKIFSNVFNNYLGTLACKNYVKSLSKEDFNELVKEFIIDNNFNRKVCFKCLLQKYNEDLKDLFGSIMIRYQCENNDLYTGEISSYKMMKCLIKNGNLKISADHYKIHRKKVYINGRKVTNLDTSNSFQFNLNEPLNINFTDHNPNEIFVFGAAGNQENRTPTVRRRRTRRSRTRMYMRRHISTFSGSNNDNILVGQRRRLTPTVFNPSRSYRRRTDNNPGFQTNVNEVIQNDIVNDITQLEDVNPPILDNSIKEEPSNQSINQGEECVLSNENDSPEESKVAEENDRFLENRANSVVEETMENSNSVETIENNETEETIENSDNDDNQESEEIFDDETADLERSIYATTLDTSRLQDTGLRIRIPIVNIPSEDEMENRFSRMITDYNESNIFDIRYNVEEDNILENNEIESRDTHAVTEYLKSVIDNNTNFVEINIDDQPSLKNFIINCPEFLHSRVNINTNKSKINGEDLVIIRNAFNEEKSKKEEKPSEVIENDKILSDYYSDSIDYEDIEDELTI